MTLINFLEKPLKSIPKKAKVVHLMDISGLEIHKFREKNIYGGHDDHDKHGHKEDKHDDHDKHGHAHAHGEFDVHIWLDPNNAKVIVKEVANQLATLDSKNSDFYKDNSIKTINKLDNLINKIDKSINKKASFVTFHDAYQFFRKTT